MFNQYSKPLPEFKPTLEGLTVAEHESLLGALCVSPTEAKTVRVGLGLSIEEFNRAVKLYRRMERAVQQAILRLPDLAEGTARAGLVTRFEITVGLATALISAMRTRNDQGATWGDLKMAIADPEVTHPVQADPEEATP